MVQRFALLEQIQTRYGVNNNSTGTGTELTFATPSPKTVGEQANTFTSEAAMPAASFVNAQPGTSIPSSSSNQAPTAKFRISRKAVPLESESFPAKADSEPLSSPTQPIQPGDRETLPSDSSMILPKRISDEHTKTSARNSEIPSNSQDLLTAREIPLQVDASTSPQATKKSPLVIRKDTTENLEEEIQPQPILRAKPLANNIPSPTQAFSPAQAETNTPLVLRKDTTENLEEEIQPQPILRAKPLANNIPSPTQAFSPAQAEANTPLVLRKATTENLEEEIQRQPERLAVSREIPGNMASLPQSTMVWRKSSQSAVLENNFSHASNGGTNNSLPLAIAPVHHNGQANGRSPRYANALQTSPAPMSKTMPMSNPTMSMPRQAAMPIPEINVAEIAEQVSRILCRQLTVERERRGMRK
jgi:hypothetical protein